MNKGDAFEMITRDMTIDEIFQRFPSKSQKLAQEMASAGLHCVGCSASTWETIEAGMYSHGMEDHQINNLLTKLNAILEEQQDLSTVTITERAAKKYREILQEEQKIGWGLRFGEKAAGCSGFEFFIDFSEKPKTDDLVVESNGISIHMHNKSAARLIGSVIDYVDGLRGAGFKISNPNVKSSCGCGTSHGY